MGTYKLSRETQPQFTIQLVVTLAYNQLPVASRIPNHRGTEEMIYQVIAQTCRV